MKAKTKDLLVVGFALFAMFLGAGNIIFPPYMGSIAGDKWWLASLGFILTGTGLPMLGVIAVAKAGGQAKDISSPVSEQFAQALTTLILVFLGPLFAVPRTAATTIELSVRPFLPASVDSHSLLVVGSLIFFLICLYFILRPGQVIDRVGRYLTPLMLFFLLILIVLSVFRPIGRPTAPDYSRIESGVFQLGFSTGYQTMDALASIVFGGTIAREIWRKGYQGREARRLMQGVALIAGLGTMLVYLGFTWIGASGSAQLQSFTNRTSLTTWSVYLLAGDLGRILLASIIFLACLTTAIGLLLTTGQYFADLAGGRFSLNQISWAMVILSYFISIQGVEGIINLSTPLLELIYPLVIVLIVLNLVGQKVRYREVFLGGVICTLPMGLLSALKTIAITRPRAEEILTHVPLGPQGFAFFIPGIVGCLLGYLWVKWREARSR